MTREALAHAAARRLAVAPPRLRQIVRAMRARLRGVKRNQNATYSPLSRQRGLARRYAWASARAKYSAENCARVSAVGQIGRASCRERV